MDRPAGTRTPLHHEGCNAAIAQLRGRKRFHLVPAACAPVVRNHQSRFAAGDATALEPARARVFEVTLEPGELLFIPVGWWHQVEALEASMSVTFTCFAFPNRFSWNADTRR